MFIAVYEFEVAEGKAADFRHYWLEATKGIYQDCGSLGSRLHKTDKPNIYVGYAQWPSREAWRAGSLTDEAHLVALEKMRACLVSTTTRYELEVTDDYLQPAQYSA